MADFDQAVTLSAGQQGLLTPTIVTLGESSTSDLLQQAMNAVSFETDGETGVSYVEHSGGGGELVFIQEDRKLVSLDGNVAVMSVPAQTSAGAEVVAVDVSGVLYAGENAAANTVCELLPSDLGIANMSTSSASYNIDANGTFTVNAVVTSPAMSQIQISDVRSLAGSSACNKGQNTQVAANNVPSGGASSPLGSSSNPIRIIQRGNQYTAMQHLTADQLAQILQVIQEQQQAKIGKTPSSSSFPTAILYNPEESFESKVLYRITKASDTAAGDSAATSGGAVVQMIPGAELGHQKRLIRKRKKEDEDQRIVVGGELSREEKEERKKHRPRTRCGRVSKPPQYMVKV